MYGMHVIKIAHSIAHSILLSTEYNKSMKIYLSIVLILYFVVLIESFRSNIRINNRLIVNNKKSMKLKLTNDLTINLSSKLSDTLSNSLSIHSNYLSDNILTEYPLTSIIISGITIFLALKTIIYWRMQYETANLLTSLPIQSSIIEFDAIDGKNIFYLSKNCDYTAIMNPIENKKVDYSSSYTLNKKEQDKAKLNEQLILESIGKANREGLNLKGKVRYSTSQIAASSANCVISTGALTRSQAFPYFYIQEAYRILKPGGLFLFVESDVNSKGESIASLIKQVFPEVMKVKQASEKSISQANKTKNKKKSKAKGFTTTTQSTEQVSPSTEQISEIEVIDEVYNQTVEENNESIDNEIVTKINRLKPGLTYERFDNFNIEPYIIGIAVKPY